MSHKIVGNIITSTAEVDLSYIQELYESATEKEITKEKAAEYLQQFPSSIINGIIQWSESDSCVRDEIFVWFKENQ